MPEIVNSKSMTMTKFPKNIIVKNGIYKYSTFSYLLDFSIQSVSRAHFFSIYMNFYTQKQFIKINSIETIFVRIIVKTRSLRLTIRQQTYSELLHSFMSSSKC